MLYLLLLRWQSCVSAGHTNPARTHLTFAMLSLPAPQHTPVCITYAHNTPDVLHAHPSPPHPCARSDVPLQPWCGFPSLLLSISSPVCGILLKSHLLKKGIMATQPENSFLGKFPDNLSFPSLEMHSSSCFRKFGLLCRAGTVFVSLILTSSWKIYPFWGQTLCCLHLCWLDSCFARQYIICIAYKTLWPRNHLQSYCSKKLFPKSP